jgi:hypothetical protein
MPKQFVHSDPLVDQEFDNFYRTFKPLAGEQGAKGSRGISGNAGPEGSQGFQGYKGINGPKSLKSWTKRIQANQIGSESFISSTDLSLATDTLYIGNQAIASRRYPNPGDDFIPRPLFFITRPFILYRIFCNVIEEFAWPGSPPPGQEWKWLYFLLDGMWRFAIVSDQFGRDNNNPGTWHNLNGAARDCFGFWPYWDGTGLENMTGSRFKEKGYSTYPKPILDITGTQSSAWFRDLDHWTNFFGGWPDPTYQENFGWYYGGPHRLLHPFYPASKIWWVGGSATGDWTGLLTPPGILAITIVYMELDNV